MPKIRTDGGKEGLLRHVRRHRLKYIAILPSLITILNGVCGFASIVFAAKDMTQGQQFSYHRLQFPYFAIAGYMVLVAMVADMLDGRVARMSKSTSSFGGQLDSLCDVISFGIAPAFLTLKFLESKFIVMFEPHPVLESFFLRFIWLIAAAYISCAAIRLARFNVENEEDESAHMSFVGLPSPAAAGAVVSVIIFQQEMLHEIFDRGTPAFNFCENVIIYSLPLLVLAMAVLMISRIRYPHVVNQFIRGKKPFAYLIGSLAVVGMVIWFRQGIFLLLFLGFAMSGVVRWFYHKATRKAADITQPSNEAVSHGGEETDSFIPHNP